MELKLVSDIDWVSKWNAIETDCSFCLCIYLRLPGLLQSHGVVLRHCAKIDSQKALFPRSVCSTVHVHVSAWI